MFKESSFFKLDSSRSHDIQIVTDLGSGGRQLDFLVPISKKNYVSVSEKLLEKQEKDHFCLSKSNFSDFEKIMFQNENHNQNGAPCPPTLQFLICNRSAVPYLFKLLYLSFFLVNFPIFVKLMID